MSQRDDRAILSQDTSRPYFALACTIACLVAGMWVVAHGAAIYPGLPERVPTHFGLSGEADAWSTKSFASVMLLPIMAMLLGPMLSGFSTIIAWQVGSTRSADPRVAYGERSARDLALFMGGLALLVSGLQVTLSWGALEVARGTRTSIPSIGLWFGGGLLLYVIVGAIILIKRQWDWPKPALLSDSGEHWRWGVLYVNPDDPALVVPKRLGYGWTLNFGHDSTRRLGWAFVAAMGLILGLAAVAIVAGGA